MIEPRRLGRFLTTDAFGCVQPDVAIERVDNTWKPLVELAARSLMQREGVRSVYVRGSIPRGLAIKDVSDADFIYFSELNFDRADRDLEHCVKAAFPFVREVTVFRLDRTGFDRIHHPQRRPYFHMLIKTQSLLLAGDDMAKDVGPFRIGLEMASHVFALANEFAQLPRWLSGLPQSLPQSQRADLERSMRRWISRRIVRSGFEVTMDRTDRFTRDLYLCYEQFATFYPQRTAQMYSVLVNGLNGDVDPLQYRELVDLLVREGLRLLD